MISVLTEISMKGLNNGNLKLRFPFLINLKFKSSDEN